MESEHADFHSRRLQVRQRKQTLVDELASEESRRYHNKKYSELQLHVQLYVKYCIRLGMSLHLVFSCKGDALAICFQYYS